MESPARLPRAPTAENLPPNVSVQWATYSFVACT